MSLKTFIIISFFSDTRIQKPTILCWCGIFINGESVKKRIQEALLKHNISISYQSAYKNWFYKESLKLLNNRNITIKNTIIIFCRLLHMHHINLTTVITTWFFVISCPSVWFIVFLVGVDIPSVSSVILSSFSSVVLFQWLNKRSIIIMLPKQNQNKYIITIKQ